MATPPLPSDFTGLTAIVTGSSGFVGRRLCEVLAERGARKVIGLDVAVPDTSVPSRAHPSHAVIEFRRCDITDREAVLAATEAADCVWHIAALVGPFHPRHAYERVNYHGTLHVLAACRRHGVGALVYASSPSTRFDGRDIRGRTERELRVRAPGAFLEPYAEAKARGEAAVLGAAAPRAMAIAPHQVYGARDPIFLPNLMEAARSGALRVFGHGNNRVSMVHVDNYCHALVLGYHALARTPARASGEFVIVTDGGSVRFWDVLDDAAVRLGFASLRAKTHLPRWLLMAVAYLLAIVGRITGRSFKLTPFTVTMLTIDRWFDISKARDLLGYEPLVSFEEGWNSTVEWFMENREFMQRCASKTRANKVFEREQTH